MFSLCRQCYLVILCIFVSLRGAAQYSHCDSIEWNFGVNQFAIDGDNLLADLAEKGWDEGFFQSKQIEVTIFGATDCPGTLAYNTKLAGNRALYLRNYFEVTAFPALTIADSYALPERNCVRPGQGYNRADRVTHLKVCWNDEGSFQPIVQTARNDKPIDTQQTAERVIADQPSEEKFIQQAERVADSTASVVTQEQEIAAAMDSARVQTEIIAPAKSDSLAAQLEAPADTAMFILPTKPKKVMTVENTEDLNAGDEIIVEGLNFYPGSHRTLPEAKSILKKLLETMQNNPTMMIEIQGHVCCATKPNEDGLDDETGDFRLSWNRAQFVRDYLVQNGIAENRITYRGYAMTHPLVYPEITIQDQIKNRRVEILITAE